MPYVVLAVGLGLSGVLFYVMYSAGRLRNETAELAWAAEEIARGNLGVKLDAGLLTSQDGVGNLARVFDEMRKSVKAGTDDLKKANEDLVHIDKMKEEFSSMVSPKLKSPLTPIKFGADSLLDPESAGNLTEDQKGYARMVMRNAVKMENLINDLMDSYKLDIDKLALAMTENDIGQMVFQSVGPCALCQGQGYKARGRRKGVGCNHVRQETQRSGGRKPSEKLCRFRAGTRGRITVMVSPWTRRTGCLKSSTR